MHRSWMSPKVEYRQSAVHGYGIIARETIKSGEKILIWGGESYTDRDGAIEARRQNRLVMQWDNDLYSCEPLTVDEDEDERVFQINHSCEPNTWMTGAFTVTARKDIKRGQEITIDYGLWLNDESYVADWKCNCGSPNCRQYITGKDWQNPILQKRYRGHFSPFLNKHIAKDFK